MARGSVDYAKERLGHWAYRLPARSPVPETSAKWGANPVDSFVLATLERNGLSASPLAGKRTLIRRATFDLHGLPPSFAEVEEFVNDSSPDAYRRLIDRLLESPRYGERWGRHWLDVARYADTQGYNLTRSSKYPFAYTYRDYVIRSFNEDKPFDRFILEQLAADLLEDPDQRNLAALGFLTTGERFINKPHEIANDRLDVTTQGFLAMTIGCARCHDHKADPIPSADYYSLFGVFMSTQEPKTEELPVIGKPASDEAHRKFLAEKAKLEKRVEAKLGEVFLKARKEWPGVVDGLVDYLGKNRLSKKENLRDYRGRPLRKGHVLFLKDFVSGQQGLKNPFYRLLHMVYKEDADKRIPQLVRAFRERPDIPLPLAASLKSLKPATRKQVYEAYRDLLKRAFAAPLAPEFTRVRSLVDGEQFEKAFGTVDKNGLVERNERDQLTKIKNGFPKLLATEGAPPRAMVLYDKAKAYSPYVFLRGKPENRGPSVERRFPQVLSLRDEHRSFKQGSGRLELARAIADSGNPLTARVIVNRVWQWHFGQGIAPTPSEFGKMGMAPTNPELLDHLAIWFVENGWSIKKLHRYLMNSSTYRQQSLAVGESASSDEANRFLWRMNPRRLEWEAMRDSILHVSGSLSHRDKGGLPVDLLALKERNFRSVFGFLDRERIPGVLRTFDFPTPQVSCEARVRTVVPQQGLFLMNSKFVVESSKRMAALLPKGSPEARVRALFRRALSREPTPIELSKSKSFVLRSSSSKQDGTSFSSWDALAQVMLMSNEFLYVD